jgi:hypothetical protein
MRRRKKASAWAQRRARVTDLADSILRRAGITEVDDSYDRCLAAVRSILCRELRKRRIRR